MATETKGQFDDTGKVVFDDCYDQPDPREYFMTLRDLRYGIAGEAQPIFRDVLGALRVTRNVTEVKTIDLGCSYGINVALMTCDIGLDDLYARYNDADLADLDREELLERDIRFYQEHRVDEDIETVGIDPAANAVRYARDAELLDAAITRNLEEEPFDPADARLLDGADLVMSTGCIGYVTERSIERVLDVTDADRPWMAHSVLRMFSYEPFEELLAGRGYVTERIEGTLPQRRFASDAEQANVIDNLDEMGIDPEGKESDGWYHANFYVSRPIEDAGEPLSISI